MFPFGAALGASPARDPRDPAAASPQESGHHGERPRTRTGPTSAGMGQTSPSAPNQKVVGLGLDKTLRLKVSRRPCRGSSRPDFCIYRGLPTSFAVGSFAPGRRHRVPSVTPSPAGAQAAKRHINGRIYRPTAPEHADQNAHGSERVRSLPRCARKFFHPDSGVAPKAHLRPMQIGLR